VLILQGKLRDAEVEAQRAVNTFPTEQFLWNIWGAVLARQNRLVESEEVLQSAVTRFHDSVTKISLAGSIRRQGVHRLEEALHIVDEVLKEHPSDVFALAEKSRILGDMGDFEQATSIMEELRHRDPRFTAEKPDLLTDFLAAGIAWQDMDNVKVPVADTEDSPTSEPVVKETPTVPEKGRNHEDFEPGATQRTPAQPAVVRPDESKAAEASSRPDLAAAASSTSAVAKQDQRKLLTTINEARLLRKWARRNEFVNESPTPAELRRKSSRLLDSVLSRMPNHPIACLEKANLLIESGSLKEAQRFLEDRIDLMPSALGLRQALGRVNRESARDEGLKFDDERYAVLTKPLLQLKQRNPAFEPLVCLGRGRICFAMRDGQALRNTEANDFERLRKHISQIPQRDGEFHAWWSEQIRTLLFLKLDPRTPVTADNVKSLEQGLEESGLRIDSLEEDFTIRMSR
jgi:tetratricopeptide (TPR) repeat protein